MESQGIPPNIQATTIPILLGSLLNWGLYGVLGVQVYMYYMSFPSDSKYSQCLVFGLFILETVQTAMVTQDVITRFGPGYGNLDVLNRVSINWLSIPVWSGVVSCSVQLFFAYRISKLSNSKWVSIFIATVAVMQGSAGIAQGTQAHQIGQFSLLEKEAFASCVVWLAGSAACDVIIAISMTYYLARRDTRFTKTHDIINRLIRLTIETGSLTAAVATVDIILFLAFPNNDYHLTPALTLAKLYSNTLLVILNSRMKVIGGRQDVISILQLQGSGTNHAISQPQSGMLRTQPGSANHPYGLSGISVKKEVWRDEIPLDDLEAGRGRESMKDDRANQL